MCDRGKNICVLDPIATSDHCTISLELVFGILRKTTYARLIWEYEKGDYALFRNKLSTVAWDNCFEHDIILTW